MSRFKVRPLSKEEKAWLKEAQDLFDRTPERFEFITIGDPDLSVIDKNFADKCEISDGGAEENGIVLGQITAFKNYNRFHAVAG